MRLHQSGQACVHACPARVLDAPLLHGSKARRFGPGLAELVLRRGGTVMRMENLKQWTVIGVTLSLMAGCATHKSASAPTPTPTTRTTSHDKTVKGAGIGAAAGVATAVIAGKRQADQTDRRHHQPAGRSALHGRAGERLAHPPARPWSGSRTTCCSSARFRSWRSRLATGAPPPPGYGQKSGGRHRLRKTAVVAGTTTPQSPRPTTRGLSEQRAAGQR
jgi:hypothetical protein